MLIYEYFKNSELTCQCGCGILPETQAVERLYAVRLIYGRPMTIRSAARCPAHNTSVGGAVDSKHVRGIAFDVHVPPEDEIELIRLALFVGFTGIGVKNNDFIHLDLRDISALWTY